MHFGRASRANFGERKPQTSWKVREPQEGYLDLFFASIDLISVPSYASKFYAKRFPSAENDPELIKLAKKKLIGLYI